MVYIKNFICNKMNPMFNRKLKHSETDLMRKMINDVKKINTSNSSSDIISDSTTKTIITTNNKTNNKIMKYTNKEIIELI